MYRDREIHKKRPIYVFYINHGRREITSTRFMLKNTVRRYLTFDIKSIDVIKDMIYGTLAS